MIAEIIAVGTELLMGQIDNTNTRYISSRFPDADVYVYYHTVVGDNSVRLTSCLKHALERADVVITTGGLGPTQDDLTKETISKALGLELIPDKDTLEGIHRFFKERGRVPAPNNEKQGYFPEGALILRNDNGTAPGCLIEKDEKIIIMMPGPPWEMEPMFEKSVIPYFIKDARSKLYSVYLRMFGIGESSMEDIINDLVTEQSNPTIAPYAKRGEITLRITAKYNPSEDDPEKIIAPVLNEIKNRLGEYIYSYENEELNEKVAHMLIEKNCKIALAESCTGGMLTSLLTDIPGISAVLDRSVVTYSYGAKISELGVKADSLEKHGAVSKDVAEEMANGIRKSAGSDIGIGITGIAGPGGGTDDKPVGLVYVALSDKDGTVVKKLNLWGDRDRIRHSTCLNALDMIRKNLNKTKTEKI
ncbi:MAG: competence/damage-inducible protein A [Clostridiales bacterium]|nr:competence/damage-inducible protein A [Clostridiales bacterium]